MCHTGPVEVRGRLCGAESILSFHLSMGSEMKLGSPGQAQ